MFLFFYIQLGSTYHQTHKYTTMDVNSTGLQKSIPIEGTSSDAEVSKFKSAFLKMIKAMPQQKLYKYGSIQQNIEDLNPRPPGPYNPHGFPFGKNDNI